MRKAQYYLGIQCSLSKGDGKEMKELMNESLMMLYKKVESRVLWKNLKELKKLGITLGVKEFVIILKKN